MKRTLPPNLSVWYHLDSFVCGLTVFGSFLLMLAYRYVAWLFCGALLTAVLLRFLPWLYSRDYPHSTPFLMITAAIRALLWTAAIGGLALPFVLAAIQQRWAYPFQRALFLSNYRSDSIVCTLLPETLPDKTEQYSVRMVPAMGQGAAGVDLSFRTDTETAAGYCRTAELAGAVKIPQQTDEDTYNPEYEKWVSLTARQGASGTDRTDAAVYVLGRGSSNTAVWVINPETGYFCAWW